MPILTMRNKLQETKCLRVCQKSNAVAKRSCSHLEIHHSAAGNCTTNQSFKDVYPGCELNAHDTGTVGNTNCEELVGGEDMQFKKLRTSSDDCAVIEHMELPVVSCSTNLETIFSPILGQINVGNPYTSTGVCIDQGSFNFSMADESDGNSGSSSYHQTCNFSDFYISDMVLASLQFDGVYVCDDIAETLAFPEFDSAESNIFDVMDQRMSLPFLGDLLESSESLNARSSEEARLDCDDSGVLLAIHQICSSDQETESRPCFDSDEAQYFDPQSFIRNLPDLSDVANEQTTFSQEESRERKIVTLVLDLDETLVHSTLEYCEDADFTFSVFFNMKESTVYVKERPHLRTFLEKAAELFEVIVFTASQSIYAEKLLDILDPNGQLISGRAYRESCIFVDGSYTKDLTVLGLDLAKVMIIDNSPQVFRLQVNNGIPIKSWFDDPSDNELISLIPFLETLVDVVDVRPIIAERFGDKE